MLKLVSKRFSIKKFRPIEVDLQKNLFTLKTDTT